MSAPELKGATQSVRKYCALPSGNLGTDASFQWAQDSQGSQGLWRIGSRGLQVERNGKPCWEVVGRDFTAMPGAPV